ncbi:SAM-dependent methyltransferase [Streptomyces griseoincarnatus]|uniref:Uncharacterized protein n=2 Tax=Streptomyces griseoincarnatus group TaxID=2867193 RepID=A0ABP6JMS7_9ACTN|nr:SAM-dependent methyltransferase [Streptomyces variabilis]MQL62195.1 hypothetical protein [Streptomyces vinaceus]GGP71874.1 hypothetical protein GCM10010265_57670 [Streptomyces griseoincarnatus]GGT44521.1 hypothetical protein GCM10010287_16990 [Streptomyces variabilis]
MTVAASGGVTLAPRSRMEIARFLEGLERVGPGVVRGGPADRPAPGPAVGETVDEHAVASRYGAVAR